jgi:hypothetical protein
MAKHDFQEFVGAVVAVIMLEMGILAHVVGFAVIERGDDVPGRAAARHQVQRRKAARDIERLVVSGRGSRTQSEPCRRHAHRGQHDQRVHLHAADAVFDGVGVVVAVTVRHREAIVEERHVEFAGFENARDLLVVIRRHGVVAGFRMSPGARQIRAVLRLQEADHHHLPCHAALPSVAGYARSSSLASLYSPASDLSFSQVASSISMPFLRRSCSRRYSTSPG